MMRLSIVKMRAGVMGSLALTAWIQQMEALHDCHLAGVTSVTGHKWKAHYSEF